MDLQFGDIQETALVTLAIRASETARPNPRIVDVKAAEIIDALGVDVSKYDPFLSHEGVVARTIMFADALRGLITRYPDALCVNLGCGFDDKFSQVDNGQIEWFDVDLPDQIAVRRKVYEDRPRCTMMEGDALDGAGRRHWHDVPLRGQRRHLWRASYNATLRGALRGIQSQPGASFLANG